MAPSSGRPATGGLIRFLTDNQPVRKLEESLAAVVKKAIESNPEKLRQLDREGANPKKLAEVLRDFTPALMRGPQGFVDIAKRAMEQPVIERVLEKLRTGQSRRRGRSKRRQEFTEEVDLAGSHIPGGHGEPHPQAYKPDKDPARNMTRNQVRLTKTFMRLEPFAIEELNGGRTRIVDLVALWKKVRDRSRTAAQKMLQVDALMANHDVKFAEYAQHLLDREVALAGGRGEDAAALLRQAEAARAGAAAFKTAAKKIATPLYEDLRDAFWKEVRNDPDLLRHLKKIGLNLDEGLAPRLDGQTMTIEHLLRKSDDPRLAIAPENFVLSLADENSRLLELLKAEPAIRQWH